VEQACAVDWHQLQLGPGQILLGNRLLVLIVFRVLTGMVPFLKLKGVADPLAEALAYVHQGWAVGILAFGAVMALMARGATGRGQCIDAALYECAFNFMEPWIPAYEKLYERGAYAPPAERKRIGKLVRAPNRSPDPRYRRRQELAVGLEDERQEAAPEVGQHQALSGRRAENQTDDRASFSTFSQRLVMSSHRKNGPPITAVMMPTGSSMGAMIVRASASHPTRNAAPKNVEAGSTSR
jgi:hypothetical protein